jgi:secreted trypsin-like serine protease
MGWRHVVATAALVAVTSVVSLGISGPVFAANSGSGSEVTPLIVGGEQATIADAPWQVALITASASNEWDGQFCGGSLIATQWVATAAHCVVSNGSPSSPSSIKILAGQATLSQVSNTRAVAVSNIYVHPLYSSSTDTDDIALIKLTTPLTLVTGSIQTIDLPSGPPTLGGPVLITGWGSVAFGSNNYPTVLRKTTVDILPDATCNASYSPGYDANKMLCAGSSALDRDTCQGDSGGPLARFAETWVLQGITSFGSGCANGQDPGVYTEVNTYRSWIAQYVTKTFSTTPTPTLSGTLTVGETLTADAGAWSPTPDSYSYVWKRASSSTATSWTTISGQSGSSYLLAAADRGQFIRVEVTAVKTGYTSPSPAKYKISTSAVTAPFTTAPTPTISVSGGGTAAVGKTLSVTTGTWSPTATLTYVWKRNGVPISSATSPSYTLVAADAGQPISVAVTGAASTYVTTTKESAATANVIKGTFTTAPTPMITGTPIANQVLGVTVGTWVPALATSPVETFYQWNVGGVPVSDGSGVASTYTVKPADAGSTITVTVTAKKAGYDEVSKTSSATASVTLPLIAGALSPTITPTTLLKPGVTLTAKPGTAPSGATVKSYQWSRASTSTGVYTNIPDATLSTYTLTGADAAKYLKVTVTWAKTGNADTPKLSAATIAIAAGTFATTATPTITGSANVGSTLTANEGAWSPTPDSYTYKWMSSSTSGGTYTAISGATTKTYVLKSTDRSKFIKVEITALKSGYTTSTTFRSAATVAVGATLPQ